MSIQTTTKVLKKEDLGVVTPHEHIFIELTNFFTEHPVKGIEDPSTHPVTMDVLGILNRDPYALKQNLIMMDYETQKKEILRFKDAGGQTVVDATMPGIGRHPELLRKIEQETGLNVIMGTGFYVYSSHPKELKDMSEKEIADLMIKEIREGADGTDIKAGVIGEIGISEIFNEEERRVLRAAAIAHKETGVGILVHINPWTTNGLESVEILLSMGVDPKRITISHIDVENRLDYILKLLEYGVYVEFDNFGKEYYVDREVRNAGYGLFVTDVERVKLVKLLIDKGYLNQILLSCDVCLKTCLRTYGAWGYDHLLTNILPMMEDEGITQEQIDTMLKTNPQNWLDNDKGE